MSALHLPLKIAIGLSVLVVLAVPNPAAAIRPTVVSTDPANGATGVATDLETVVITFSETMGPGISYNGLSGFNFEWAPDQRSLTLNRSTTSPAWRAGQVVTVTLNPPPYYSFADLDGNELATYAFTFTVGDPPDPGTPTVVATTPVNGDADIDVDLDTVSIEFSEAMAGATAMSISGPWNLPGGEPHTWSADGRTLTINRNDTTGPLPTFSVVTVILNPQGTGFEDLDGHPLGAVALVFTTGGPDPGTPPAVQSSAPADGARGVGLFRDSMSVTFTKPMTSGFNMVCDTGNWDVAGSTVSWSTGNRGFTLYRPDDGTLLPEGALISFTLNPGGATDFRDTNGNPLPSSTISFNVEGSPRLLKVRPRDSRYGFDWPYYLWIPATVAPHTVILVEPNNTGSTFDEEIVHEASALSLLGWRSFFAERLNVPLLVPAFPRPRSDWQIYTHALDVDTMTATSQGLVRIDLQLIEMIEDARERLTDLRVQTDAKVLMMGFSASGQFTNRFAILHPERILAAAAGSPGGWPLAPVDSWQGETLNYNVGIADAESLLGITLDMSAVRGVPLFLYMGDADTNDSVPFGDAYSDEQREQVNRLFGTTPVERWPAAEAIYEAAGMNATFTLYPGVEHTITDEMLDDIAAYFTSHLRPAKGWLRGSDKGRATP